MGIVRPTGGFAEGMLEAGGWPDIAEDVLYERAQQYTRVLHQVAEVAKTCQEQQYEIFQDGVWSGSAACAADGELGRNIDELEQLQNGLATVITWQRFVAGSIEQAKSDIDDNVAAAQRRIDSVERDRRLKPDERTAAINSVVSATRTANVSVMQGAAERIRESRDWKPPERALRDLLNQRPLLGDRDRNRSGRSWGQGLADSASQPPTGAPAPAAVPPPTTAPPAPAAPAAATGGPAAAPAAAKPLSPAASAGPTAATAPNKPAVPTSLSTPPRGSGPGVAPASATGVPAAPKAPGGSRGAAAGSSTGSGAPVGQHQTGASHGVRPASATAQPAQQAATGADDPGPRPKPVGGQSDAGAGVPVSAARAERDAAAAAARRGDADPLVLARRIAAALNVPGRSGVPHLKFFWATAVSTEGDIVVANNYGLAYIPDGVQLPDRIHMASADASIPPPTRASWATYPMSALQGWAENRNVKLRAVIATDEQFKDSDPGVSKVVLKPDDIPISGAMAGRSRLEVVDRRAAKRLSATPDERVAALLPAASATPPNDRRSKLWLDTMRPLASRAAGRSAAHLRAFRAYTAHAQEVILSEARTTVEPAAQRAAVADWMYWKHLTELVDAAAAQASKMPAAKS